MWIVTERLMVRNSKPVVPRPIGRYENRGLSLILKLVGGYIDDEILVLNPSVRAQGIQIVLSVNIRRIDTETNSEIVAQRF
jgi:hypothetical protein